MNTKEDKHIEKLIDKMMKDQTLETPSFDFTSKVMNQVMASKKSQAFTYKPLISKKILFYILGSLAILIIYSLFYDAPGSIKWIPHIDFIPMRMPQLTGKFEFSKVTTYSVVLTTLMLLIQIPLLKNYFDKKYN